MIKKIVKSPVLTSTQQTLSASLLITNDYQGDKLNTINQQDIRIFYININGLYIRNDNHSLIHLCITHKKVGVDIVCLTETKVNWKRYHIVSKFRQSLKSVQPTDKITMRTSNSNLQWNTYYKPGGTTMYTLNTISSAVLKKEMINQV